MKNRGTLIPIPTLLKKRKGENMKERNERIKKNIRVLLNDGEGSYSGIIANFSRTGMSIKTDHIFPTFKLMDICVKIGQKVVPIKGSVRWVKESVGEPEEPRHLVGISLVNPSPEYLKYFEQD